MTSRGARSTSPSARRRPARRGEGERLRGEIVDAAIRLLADTGNTGTLSLRAVAREVGVAATSIYLHFPDLDTLLREVKTQLFDRLTGILGDAANEAGADPYRRVLAEALAYVRFGLAEPGLYSVMFSSPTLSPKYLKAGDYIGKGAFDIVRQGVVKLLGDDEAEIVTLHVWTALHGKVLLRGTRTNFPWPDVEDDIGDLVERLTGAGGARPGRRRQRG